MRDKNLIIFLLDLTAGRKIKKVRKKKADERKRTLKDLEKRGWIA